MPTVSIHDAKTNLSKYIAAAKKGKQILIGGFGVPEVKLVKVQKKDIVESSTRNFAAAKGKVSEHKDSFSKETEEIIADQLNGKKS